MYPPRRSSPGTISGASELGTTCLVMIRQLLAPSARAATTKSALRTWITDDVA